MRKNRIEGIRPLSGFIFKNCYYHQLIAGLACFGINKDNILLNSFVKIQDDFAVEHKEFYSKQQLGKLLGYKIINCNITLKQLIRSINKQSPIIVGVDCYYLKSRKDTYLLKHAPHYILVYGYDLVNKTINIVDHHYINSTSYQECIMPLNELLFANDMFKKHLSKRRYTCNILRRIKIKKDINLWSILKTRELSENNKNAVINLKKLKYLFLNDSLSLKERMNNLVGYFQELKLWTSILLHSDFLMNSSLDRGKILLLHNDYSNFVSYFWIMQQKNNYNCNEKMINSIVIKIDEMISLENDIYKMILEAECE